MRPRALAVLTLTCALGACASRTPLPVEPTLAEWQTVAAGNYTCKPGQFVDVGFDAVVAAPERYYETCIRLRALYANNALFRDAAGLKAAGLAIAVMDGKMPTGLSSHPQFVVVAGRLRSCPRMNAQYMALHARSHTGAQTAIAFHFDGICGNSGGPQLFVNAIAPMPTAMD